MPKKINVVNLSHVKEDVESSSTNEQLSNDEQQLSQIKEEIKKEETLQPEIVEEVKPIDEVKPKPKRKPAQKKVKEEVAIVEPVVEKPKELSKQGFDNSFANEKSSDFSIPKEEPVVEAKEEPQKKTKTVELVKCPKCHKEMTKRTLRYDHEKTCAGEKIEREKIPVKRRTPIKKETVETKPQPINIPEDIIEQEVRKRIQNTVQDRIQQKMKLKEERIKKLSAQIA